MNCKPSFCSSCPINHVTDGYVPLHDVGGSSLVVLDAPRQEDAIQGKPNFDGIGNWFYSVLGAARIDKKSLNQINIIGCHPPMQRNRDGSESEGPFPGSKKWTATPRADAKAAVEYCRQHHLKPALRDGAYDRIYAMGENALQATTPRFGISFWRGSALPLRDHMADGPKVIATLDALSVMKNPNMFSVTVSDMKKGLVLPPENYNLRPSISEVCALAPTKFSFDLEWNELGEPTICGITDKYYNCTVVPWQEPYLTELRRIFRGATSVIGHNIIGADLKYIEDLIGQQLDCSLEDTILKQHLVQPDLRHSLALVASIFTSKVFWKGKWDFEGEVSDDADEPEILTGTQWRTWDTPEAIPREFGGYGGCDSAYEAFRLYNARDTDAQFQANFPLDSLLRQHGLEKIYRNVSIPTARLCREMGDRGIRIDHTPQFTLPERGLEGPVRIQKVHDDLVDQIGELEAGLPEELRSHEVSVVKQRPAPPDTYKPAIKHCKGTKKAKTAHEPVDVMFYAPGDQLCPVCATVIKSPAMEPMKTVKSIESETVTPWNSTAKLGAYAAAGGQREIINRKTGNPTTGAKARKAWGRSDPTFQTIDKLKKCVTMKNNFAKPGLLKIDRVQFNLMVFGTATGRLACSGREPANLNLQNQPEGIKHIFVPDQPGYSLLELDFSGGENNLTAFLANDTERLERLRDPDYDEHSELASMFFETAVNKVLGMCRVSAGKRCLSCEGCRNDELRKAGKIFNHGKTYGMGIRTMQENFMLEGFNYPESKIREFDRKWRVLNAGTARWQDATTALAGRQGFLRNAFARMRWFQCVTPDTLTLKGNLEWVPIGTIKEGDELVGFDEDLTNPRYRPSIVESARRMTAPLYEVVTDKGTIKCTPNHGWATRIECGKSRHAHRWITTEYLLPGDKIVYFGKPWLQDQSHEASWLSGVMDGEGCVTSRQGRGEIRFSQNPGPVMERTVSTARALGLTVSEPRPTGTRSVTEVRITNQGHPRSALSIVGKLRPTRLLNDARCLWRNKIMWGKSTMKEVAVVKSVKYIGEGEVMAVQTSTKTLLTDGLCSHNSRDYGTKALAFLPSSTLADIAMRCMIALHASRFPKELNELGVRVRGDLPAGWRLVLQVHDSLLLSGPTESLLECNALVRAVMTQPWAELDGFALRIASKASDSSWGEMKGLKD